MITRLRKAAGYAKWRATVRFSESWRHVLKLAYRLPEVELDALAPGTRLDPVIKDDICLPPHHGPTDHDDYSSLMRLASALRPKVIVELGTAHGNTVANLCHFCPEARVYTVNAPADVQTGETITFVLGTEDIGRVYRRHGYGDRVVQIFKNTLDLDLAEYLTGPVVDLAIVDACHDTPYVFNDFLKVQPFVRPGGVVLLHDTHPSMAEHLHGSYVACMRLRQRGYDIRHVRDTWWGIWRNGPWTGSLGASA